MKKKDSHNLVAILAGPLDNQNAGVHVYTKELINALAKQKEKKNHYILIREKKSNDFSEFRSIVVPTITWIPGFASLRLFIIIPLICWWLNVDVVVEPAHFGPFNLPKSIKRVTVIHDLTPILFPEYHTFLGSFLQRVFLPIILRNTDIVITNSKHTSQDVGRIYPFAQRKIKPIYLGFSEDMKPSINPNVLKQYKIDNPFFLFIGTIEPRKNLEFLLDAFDQFCDEGIKDWQLVIAGGTGWKAESFYEKYEKSSNKDRIILTNYVPQEELAILYSMASIFIYPSIYEGFGLPIVEAMACETACIISNTSSLTEIGNGYCELFELGNQQDLVSKMLYLSRSPKIRASIGKEARKYVHEQFSWSKCAYEFDAALYA